MGQHGSELHLFPFAALLFHHEIEARGFELQASALMQLQDLLIEDSFDSFRHFDIRSEMLARLFGTFQRCEAGFQKIRKRNGCGLSRTELTFASISE
ncbi:hypothetical protein JTB14_024460 [Gonioctena quinquepunctata]|nr:hypothetical protein JTB14_024460 [Gonioctena quinquepunctata]